MAGGAERLDARVGVGVGAVLVAQVHEHAVVAVGVGLEQRLVGHRQDAAALLAGALGDELLDPQAEARDRLADDERELVAAARGRARRSRDPATGPGLLAVESKCAHACSAAAARSSSACTGAPISAAGTRPNSDSAE